jgi:hypothetical protein
VCVRFYVGNTTVVFAGDPRQLGPIVRSPVTPITLITSSTLITLATQVTLTTLIAGRLAVRAGSVRVGSPVWLR